MDALAALRLLVDWGADEALDDVTVDRRSAPAPKRLQPPAPAARPAASLAVPLPATAADAAALAAAAETPAALRAAMAGFEGCQLRFTAKSLAFADGNPEAGLVVVGEVASDDDDREGRPFAGAGGAMLDMVFASAGLTRADMLLTLLVPWRPPGKRNPSPGEVAACLPFLLRHVALLRPRRLVLFGGGVTKALGLGADPIGRLRGTWRGIDIPGLGSRPALPMKPVDAAMKTPAGKRELWADLLSLRAELESDGEDLRSTRPK